MAEDGLREYEVMGFSFGLGLILAHGEFDNVWEPPALSSGRSRAGQRKFPSTKNLVPGPLCAFSTLEGVWRERDGFPARRQNFEGLPPLKKSKHCNAATAASRHYQCLKESSSADGCCARKR